VTEDADPLIDSVEVLGLSGDVIELVCVLQVSAGADLARTAPARPASRAYCARRRVDDGDRLQVDSPSGTIRSAVPSPS